MPRFFRSLVFKITLTIFLLETLVLAAMGHYYVTRFRRGIDTQIQTAARIPGTLMDQGALGYGTARDLAALERLVGEEVVEAAVVRGDGQVFFASDRGKEDLDVLTAYGSQVAWPMRQPLERPYLSQITGEGEAFLVSISPIRSRDKLIGYVYLKVDTSRSVTAKRNIVILFLLGSALCVLLTTLVEVIIVHFLVGPRIRRTVGCLEAVKGGDLQARVTPADSDDEIGVLQRSVNAMVSEIEDRTAEVREINRRLQDEIAERKRSEQSALESEQRFRDLAELLPEIIYEMDASGRLTFVNQQGLERLGFTADDIGDGHNAIDFFIPQDRERALENMGRLLKSVLKGGREYTMRRKGGGMVPVMIFSAPIIQNGKAVGLRGLIVDMTRQKDLEERLRQAAKMEAVGTLAGGIAHDFNNILQAISGYAELLLSGFEEGSAGCGHAAQINRAADRGAELVRSLLAFSRRDEPALRPLDLNREVAQTVRLLERTIPKMIRIETRLAADLRPVHADPGQLAQVLMNLGANARDAMGDGGTLLIETSNIVLDAEYCLMHPEALPGDYVQLLVSDTGEGMPPDTLVHIYDPFFTTKEVGSGTGLGLATVYGVVKGHGGHITVESQPGKGTIFQIHLPASREPSATATVEGPPPAAARGGHETLLLVDDEEPVVRLGKTLLERHGYTVVTALSGEEALDHFRARPGEIDLVILDLGMPGMGGEKCLEELLRIEPEVRVLVASGYAMDSQADEVLRAGALAFVSKPYHLEDLVRRVRQLLDR